MNLYAIRGGGVDHLWYMGANADRVREVFQACDGWVYEDLDIDRVEVAPVPFHEHDAFPSACNETSYVSVIREIPRPADPTVLYSDALDGLPRHLEDLGFTRKMLFLQDTYTVVVFMREPRR